MTSLLVFRLSFTSGSWLWLTGMVRYRQGLLIISQCCTHLCGSAFQMQSLSFPVFCLRILLLLLSHSPSLPPCFLLSASARSCFSSTQLMHIVYPCSLPPLHKHMMSSYGKYVVTKYLLKLVSPNTDIDRKRIFAGTMSEIKTELKLSES